MAAFFLCSFCDISIINFCNNICRLMLTPLVPLFGYDVTSICPFPFLSNKFDVTVSHAESINILYVQDSRQLDNLADYLEELYVFYGEENEGK